MNQRELDFCLLIPCYNNFEGLVSSLESVKYAPDRFLIVVVDDGSIAPVTEERLRVRLGGEIPVMTLRNEKNAGITGALNTGLDWIIRNCSARYIARLDCGDTCEPSRFFDQVAYLDQNSEVGLLGTWCRFEDPATGRGYDYVTPTLHNPIRRAMHFRNVFIHPTVMFRSAFIPQTGYYPTDFPFAEDYAFFWRLTDVHPAHVLPKVLVKCEINSTGISYKNKKRQLYARWKVVSTFSKSSFWKILGFARLFILYMLPKKLILRLKQLR